MNQCDTPIPPISPAVTAANAEKAEPKFASAVTSDSLLGERGELKIEHNRELYSLRRTRQGKLILTK